jgi:uncharacterized protein
MITTLAPTTVHDTVTAVADTKTAVTIPQYSRKAIFAIWAAAALPMGIGAWIVAPRLADSFGGPQPMFQALIIMITAGLAWQFVLLVGLVAREQRTLRWSVVREALWLNRPRSPKTGRVGGKVWLVVIPLVLLTALEEMLVFLPQPADHDFGSFMESTGGQEFLSGAWGWFALVLVQMVLNTVLAEELLFRGFLLPRMNGAFGDRDWLANGILFGAYHLHVPWVIPISMLDAFVLAYPTKRFRSAWIGIAVHSAQSVVIGLMVLGLVVS